MPTYIQLLTFAGGGKFDAKKDSRAINQALQELQRKGARIISITPAVGSAGTATSTIFTATYVITYEAPSPME